MPLGGGGGNAKDNNPGEGEGGGSPLGSRGEATDVQGPQQMPSHRQVTLPPEVVDAQGEECLVESLVGVPEGFAGWVAIGGLIVLVSLSFCLIYSFFSA